jgi:RNA polymerase sigma factor (sigma-70 family)
MSEISASGRGFGGQNRKGLACLREAEASLRRRQAVTGDAASAWFLREILPLEAILMHYLRQNWRNPSDIPDLRQEVYARVLQAARERIPDNPKRFLLTTARNLLINLVRHEQVVPMETLADFDAFELADDAPEPDRAIIEKQELHIVRSALAQLPPRTREAIELSWFENLSCTEIARRMGVTHQAASRLIANGTLILGDILLDAPTGRKAEP